MTAAVRRSLASATVAAGLVAWLCAAAANPAVAQAMRTQELVKQLTALLDAKQLDSVAARDPHAPDRFTAALYFPGSQLLVVHARYAAPALLNEKILLGNYRDVYIDLNAASDPATKVLIEDLMVDGLRARRDDDAPFDSYTVGQGERYPFDGEWRKRRIKEEEYMETFARAEQQYAEMLQALIAQMSQTAP